VNPEGLTVANAYSKYILDGGDLDKILEDLSVRYNAALDKGKASGAVKTAPMPNFDPITLQGVMSKK
jgi:multiple sugar transport system substrate-binding protein